MYKPTYLQHAFLTIYSRHTFRKDDLNTCYQSLCQKNMKCPITWASVQDQKPTTQGIGFISNPCLLPSLHPQRVYIDRCINYLREGPISYLGVWMSCLPQLSEVICGNLKHTLPTGQQENFGVHESILLIPSPYTCWELYQSSYSQQLPLFVFGEAGALRSAFALALVANGRARDPKWDLSPRPLQCWWVLMRTLESDSRHVHGYHCLHLYCCVHV